MRISFVVFEKQYHSRRAYGAIPNFAIEKEQKRNFLDFTDVTLVVVDVKSERFVKSTRLQQDLFDMTMVTLMFDTKTSESESFIDRRFLYQTLMSPWSYQTSPAVNTYFL
jgi:hypothetical protein